jgi:hypothetical protein
MHLAAFDKRYVFVPVWGPPGVDLTGFTVTLALTGQSAPEPAPGDSAWQAGAWTAAGPRPLESGYWARLLVDASAYPPGTYVLRARVNATPELPVMTAGRVVIG